MTDTTTTAAALAKARDVAKEMGFAYAGDDQDAAVAIIARAILEARAEGMREAAQGAISLHDRNWIRARADELEAMAKEIGV